MFLPVAVVLTITLFWHHEWVVKVVITLLYQCKGTRIRHKCRKLRIGIEKWAFFERQNSFHYNKDFMPHFIFMPVLLHPLVLYHTYQRLFAMENVKFTVLPLPTILLIHEYLLSKCWGWDMGNWPIVSLSPCSLTSSRANAGCNLFTNPLRARTE